MSASHPDTAYLNALDMVAEGELQEIACLTAGVTRKGLWEWSQRTEANRSAFAHARLSSAAALEEEILDAVRNPLAREVLDPQLLRTRVDALKWAAAKRHPKEYGDKVDVTSGGSKVGATVLILPAERIPHFQVSAQIAQDVTPQQLTSGDDSDTELGRS